MLGPYDFSLNINSCFQPDHPDMVAAIERVHTESAKAGKSAGMDVGFLGCKILDGAWLSFFYLR